MRDLICLGQIKERNWYGEDGIEHVRTIKEPKQAIPTFAETIELLMKVSCPSTCLLFFTQLLSFLAGEPTRQIQRGRESAKRP